MRKQLRTRTVILWGLTGIWTIVLFILAGQDSTQSAQLSAGLMAFLLRLLPIRIDDPAEAEHVIRKLAHFTIFTIEGMLMGASLLNTRPKKTSLLIFLPVCAVLAVLNELFQMTAEGRSCEIGDMLIDLGGAVFGLAVLLLIICLFCRKRRYIRN